MGNLRLLQAAFPQAVELYKRSLDFEQLPDTHVDLAVAYMRSKRIDDALSEAANAIFSDPQNARAWHVQGKSWMMKSDPQNARAWRVQGKGWMNEDYQRSEERRVGKEGRSGWL